jgi:hypothetical protein
MAKSNYDMVKEWTEIFCPDQINNQSQKAKLLRLGMLQEELSELTMGFARDNRLEQLDAFVDLEWLTYGAYLLLGEKPTEPKDLLPPHASLASDEIIASLQVGSAEFARTFHLVKYTLPAIDSLLHHIYTCRRRYFSDANVNEAFKRVYISNMSKLDDDGRPVRDEAGRILKGPNYVPPNLEDLV